MKKVNIFLVIISLIASSTLRAQVAINTDGSNPNPAALLDVKSTDKGMLIPRMTTSQRTAITTLADGLSVYDTDTKSFWFYNNSTWSELINNNNLNELADADKDTKIEVDKNGLDQDVIRFSTDGTEHFVMGSGILGVRNTGESVFIGYAIAAMDDHSNNRNIAIGSWTMHLNETGEKNIAMGYNSLYNNVTGSSNISLGAYALSENTNISDLIAIGDSALFDNGHGAITDIQGIQNTAIGSKALKTNTYGSYNTALGYQTLYANSSGSSNTAVGKSALHANTSGNNNTAYGSKALLLTTTGSQNTAIGAGTLQNTTSNFNTAIGSTSLCGNTTGQSNTAVGTNSLENNLNGNNNTGLGSNALGLNTSGNNNIAIGLSANYWNSSGNANVAIGNKSLYYSQNTDNLVAIGDSSLFYNGFSGTGTFNTALGAKTLRSNRGGDMNTATGYYALYSNVSGDNNTATGANALYSNTDYDNSAFGNHALNANTTGTSNTALGSEAMITNTTGDYNTAVGYFALGASNGNENTALGNRAISAASGDGNVAVGFEALTNTTSFHNTAIGYKAGDNITSGSNNIIIGNNIDAPSAIASDRMSIGNLIFGTNLDGTGTTYSTGNIGIGINSPTQKLDIRGNLQVKNTSGSVKMYIDGSSGNSELQFKESGAYAGAMGYNTSSNYLYLYQGGNVVLKNGNLGIGTTNPLYRLQVGNSGDGSTARANAWNTFSDKNLKKDFRKIEKPLAILNEISGYYYYWREGGDKSRQVGVIAQEVEKVLPEIVSTDSEGIKSLDYSKLTPLLIEALKSQQKTIENLNHRINVLEGK